MSQTTLRGSKGPEAVGGLSAEWSEMTEEVANGGDAILKRFEAVVLC